MKTFATLLMVAAGLGAAQPAFAQAFGVAMATGGVTTQPVGHYWFCESNPGECRRTGAADPVVLTDAAWTQMNVINQLVNANVIALTDQEIFGEPEVWAYPTLVGDCEDFVLLKRRLLAEAGWPLSDLLITMVFQADGQGHAVLTVRTDRGDYILDNLTNDVRLWTETTYIYIKRQSDRDAGTWVSIEGTRATAGGPAQNGGFAGEHGLGNIGG